MINIKNRIFITNAIPFKKRKFIRRILSAKPIGHETYLTEWKDMRMIVSSIRLQGTFSLLVKIAFLYSVITIKSILMKTKWIQS